MTECNQQSFFFHKAGRRDVVVRFDGGHISSDGGGVLLREVEQRTGIIAQLANCFTDQRDPDRVEHSVEQLIGQRVFGLALGYEDLNDHDTLRGDPLLAMMVGAGDPLGQSRRCARDLGKPLAGKSTLNRLELTPVAANSRHRYKKIVARMKDIARRLVSLFLQEHEASLGVPTEITLDLDATDDPLHGDQLGKFFHGYYGHYCYLPLYIVCGDFVLASKLRPSNIDASAGAVGELSRIVAQIRERWPHVKITIRGDSGFCRDHVMKWCESNDVGYILGLAKNERLLRKIGEQMQKAKQQCEQTGEAARVFTDLDYRTRKSWSRSRRVVAKAEHLPREHGENPRFVVTSLSDKQAKAQILYEQRYCARGDMENRIKEQQLGLFADRLSCQDMRANQVRLYLSTFAYTLLASLRRRGLAGTKLAKAQASTIRTRLLKIGVRVRVTARRIWLSMTQAFPLQTLFAHVHRRLALAAEP